MLTGPHDVAPNSTNVYTLSITGEPGVFGGLNISAEAGSLDTVDELTQLLDDEITHTMPKDFSGDTLSWDFIWTAPSAVGAVNLYAAGENDDGMFGGVDSLDVWATTILTIQVVPIPAAALLFGSALGLLGWLKRRSA